MYADDVQVFPFTVSPVADLAVRIRLVERTVVGERYLKYKMSGLAVEYDAAYPLYWPVYIVSFKTSHSGPKRKLKWELQRHYLRAVVKPGGMDGNCINWGDPRIMSHQFATRDLEQSGLRTRTANSQTSQQQQDTRQDTKQGTKQKKEKSSKPSKTKTSSSTQSTPTTNWSTMHHGRRVGTLSTGPSDRPANPMLEAAERRRQEKQQQDSNASNSVSS
ncbi:hypothetical protein Unana1_06666 [Umbelopsis nana]